jgi:hypothetical protein
VAWVYFLNHNITAFGLYAAGFSWSIGILLTCTFYNLPYKSEAAFPIRNYGNKKAPDVLSSAYLPLGIK